MNLSNIGASSLPIIISLVVAIVLLAIRIFVMQRVQSKRQRENRQETERLKSLVAAYRSLAGSFSPATGEQSTQMEESLSDIVLFGSVEQVRMAAQCAMALKRNEAVDYQPLADSLRSDLRTQLGLGPIPDDIELPDSGPSRSAKNGRGEGEGRNGGGAAGRGGNAGGGGGGGIGGAIGLGGVVGLGGAHAGQTEQQP